MLSSTWYFLYIAYLYSLKLSSLVSTFINLFLTRYRKWNHQKIFFPVDFSFLSEMKYILIIIKFMRTMRGPSQKNKTWSKPDYTPPLYNGWSWNYKIKWKFIGIHNIFYSFILMQWFGSLMYGHVLMYGSSYKINK